MMLQSTEKGSLSTGHPASEELLRAVSLVLSPQEIDSERRLPLTRRVDTNAAHTYGNMTERTLTLGS